MLFFSCDKDGQKFYSNLEQVIIHTNMLINLYPNPAQNTITVQTNGYLQTPVDIFDYTGRKVKELILVNPVTEIEIAELPSGFYYVRFVDGNVRSFIKQ